MKITKKQQAANVIKWIDKLRYYRKGVGALHRGGRHCCIGVASIVLKCPHLDLDSGDEKSEYIFVRKVTSLRDESEGCLINMNDGRHVWDRNFANITRRLKEEPERFFDPYVAKLVKKHYAK